MKYLLILFLAVTLSGCGTLYNLSQRNGEYYLATRTDLKGIEGTANPHPWSFIQPGVLLVPMIVGLFIVDIPISLTTDTLLVPHDYIKGQLSGFILLAHDDDNIPVSGVQVKGATKTRFKGITKEDGTYKITRTPKVIEYLSLTKEGYYETEYLLKRSGYISDFLHSNNTNTYPTLIRKIENPIPMYVKSVNAIVPVMGQAVGYDLEKGDWVGDHGSGVISDLIFTVTGNYVDSFNRDLQMITMFSNPEDGIITQKVPVHNEAPMGSKLKSTHEAPANGYKPEYTYIRKMRPRLADRVNMGTRRGQLSYFRVRTEVDDKGNIVKAFYGKMYGDFHCYFRSDGKARVSFTYYLNPTPNDRNVEFDPKQNIFQRHLPAYRQGHFYP